MTATTQDIKSDKLGTEEIPPPGLLGLPIETNTIIYGGTPVFSDANGYAVDGTPASGGLFCWGRSEKQVNNLNTNTPYGAAAAQNVTIRPGAYYFASDGSVTAAQVGKAVYALDNQTVTSSPVHARLYQAQRYRDWPRVPPVFRLVWRYGARPPSVARAGARPDRCRNPLSSGGDAGRTRIPQGAGRPLPAGGGGGGIRLAQRSAGDPIAVPGRGATGPRLTQAKSGGLGLALNLSSCPRVGRWVKLGAARGEGY